MQKVSFVFAVLAGMIITYLPFKGRLKRIAQIERIQQMNSFDEVAQFVRRWTEPGGTVWTFGFWKAFGLADNSLPQLERLRRMADSWSQSQRMKDMIEPRFEGLRKPLLSIVKDEPGLDEDGSLDTAPEGMGRMGWG